MLPPNNLLYNEFGVRVFAVNLLRVKMLQPPEL